MTKQYRKDGRELVTGFPVTAEDEIEYIGHVSAADLGEGIVCAYRSRDRYEAWMDDI